jgi:hypothetical protein
MLARPDRQTQDSAMRSSPFAICRRSAYLGLALLAACPVVRADALMGGAWVGSEAKVRAAADQAGLTLPPNVSLATVEGAFPFFKPGDLDRDAPVGLLFVAGDQLETQQMVAFAFPVKDGAAKLDAIPNTQKTDAADTVLMNGLAVRRTDGYLTVGASAPVVTQLDVPALVAPMKPTAGVTPLARVWLDLATWRSAAPTKFAAAMDGWHQTDMATASDPSPNGGAAWVERLVRTDLNNLSLAVDRTDHGWTATTRLEPFRAAVATFDRPGLPADCVARADLQVPADALERTIVAVAENKQTQGAQNALAARLITACFAGDAESLGAAMVNGQPVLYSVAQRRVPGDLAAEVRSIADDGAKLSATPDRDSVAVPYTASDGSTVYRFTLPIPGAAPVCVDVSARGSYRYATVSRSTEKYVPALAALPSAGTFDTAGSGWVDPGRAIDLAAGVAAPTDPATVDRLKRLASLFGDARLTWTARTAGGGLDVAVDVPEKLLHAIGPILDLLHG